MRAEHNVRSPVSVSFLDLRVAHGVSEGQLVAAAERVIRSGSYVLGSEVEAFERQWSDFCGVRHTVTVGSGLDALYFALRAVGVGQGDEVLVPSNTFIATWLAVARCGAVPVPVEPDPLTHNVSVVEAEGAVSPRTVAFVAVHLYGQPADLSQLAEFCDRKGIALVEDAAQAQGARYRGERIGGHSAAVAWSFYPGKNLGALGDGGAVTTNRDSVAQKILLLRNYGAKHKYEHQIPGYNSRLDEIQAAFLSEKLIHLDAWNARRNEIANIYSSRLAHLVHLDGQPGGTKLLALPHLIPDVESVWHLYAIRVRFRDRFIQSLADDGVEVGIHYPIPPAEQLAFRDLGFANPASFSSTTSRELVSLPIGPHLSNAQVEQVVRSVIRACARGR